jgi:hypothetical protein
MVPVRNALTSAKTRPLSGGCQRGCRDEPGHTAGEGHSDGHHCVLDGKGEEEQRFERGLEPLLRPVRRVLGRPPAQTGRYPLRPLGQCGACSVRMPRKGPEPAPSATCLWAAIAAKR